METFAKNIKQYMKGETKLSPAKPLSDLSYLLRMGLNVIG
jgi:hypothetical protein